MIPALLALGALATGGQVLALREFMVVFAGNELSLGLLFAVWFVGIALGAGMGAKLAHKLNTTEGARLAFCVCALTMLVELVLMVLFLRMWRGIWQLETGNLPGLGFLLLSGILLLAPLALTVGLSFPLACRAARDEAHDLTVGRVYVLESAGAIAGALLCTAMAMLGRGGLVLTGALGLMLTLSLVPQAWSKSSGRALRLLGGLAALLSLTLLGLWTSGQLAAWEETSTELRYANLSPGGRRVAWAATPYQFLDLGKHAGQFDLYADGKAVTSFPDPYLQRPRAHLVMVQHPKAKKILLFGSASFGALPAMLAHPIEQLDLVELDPRTYDLLKPHLDEATQASLKDQRLHFIPDDPRRFLSRPATGNYDLIFVDAPEPMTTAGNRVFTMEFYAQAKRHLAPGGLLATRLPGSTSYLGKSRASLLGSQRDTLALLFTQVLVIPGAETFFFASDTKIASDDPMMLVSRYKTRGVQDPIFSPRQFQMLVDPARSQDLLAQLKERGESRLNTDSHPSSVSHGLAVWSERSDDGLGLALAHATTWPPWLWFAGLAALMGLGLAWLGFGKREHAQWRASLLAIGVLGAAGMTLELLLSFAYQALAGSLFQELGLLVAAFMGGLVLAGWAVNRRLRGRPASSTFLIRALCALAVFSAALPLVQGLAFTLADTGGRVILLLATGIAGAGTGAIFPLISHWNTHAGQGLLKVAGGLDAADHLGAAAGAFAAGLLLLPSLGQTFSSLWIAAALAFAAMGIWLTSRLPRSSVG